MKTRFVKLTKYLGERSPVILTGLAIGGVISTAVLMRKATLDAQKILDYPDVNADYHPDTATWQEQLKLTWKCYIPPATIVLLTIAAIITTHSIHTKRQLALASLFSVTDKAFKEYKDKVIEQIGDKKELAVRDSIAKDRLMAAPEVDEDVIRTPHGNTKCFDAYTGRYFYSDIEYIRRCENELNKTMLDDMSVTLNDIYYMWSLPAVRHGDELGWNIANGFIEFRFSSHLTNKGEPCLVIDFSLAPVNDCFKL